MRITTFHYRLAAMMSVLSVAPQRDESRSDPVGLSRGLVGLQGVCRGFAGLQVNKCQQMFTRRTSADLKFSVVFPTSSSCRRHPPEGRPVTEAVSLPVSSNKQQVGHSCITPCIAPMTRVGLEPTTYELKVRCSTS